MRTLILMCLFAAPVGADTTLAYVDGAGQPSFSLAIKGAQLRMETGDDQTLLFDAGKRELTVLDASRREYLVLNQARLAELQEQMTRALAMAEQFGMSPEALGIQGGGGAARQVSTGETRTVNGFACAVNRYEVGGETQSVACIAEPASVGIADGDWRTMQQMFAMMMQMASEVLPAGMVSFDMAPPDGVAVEAHDGAGGDKQVLASVDDAVIDAGLFAIPAGWRPIRIGQ